MFDNDWKLRKSTLESSEFARSLTEIAFRQDWQDKKKQTLSDNSKEKKTRFELSRECLQGIFFDFGFAHFNNIFAVWQRQNLKRLLYAETRLEIQVFSSLTALRQEKRHILFFNF